MVSAVGLSATETAASVRAGTTRLLETDYHDKRFDRFVLGEVPDDGVPALADKVVETKGLSARELRMLRLATGPIRECLAPLAGRRLPVGLCLALPETETGRPLDRSGFVRHLASQVSGAIDPSSSDGSHQGRAGGLVALGQAVRTIQHGVADVVLAGGVDTYRDTYVLGTLDLEKRVKSSANYDGFVPGEGAAFLLLASERAAVEHALAPIARLSPVVLGFEPGHLYSMEPYKGDGLSAVMNQVLGLGFGVTADVYSSMNGESHWAKEWGVSHIRNSEAFAPDLRIHHPADCYGDTGAASGPLMVGLAALGIRGAYRSAPALVYASSDRGGRAAIVVS
jgi:3-oxoacyl-[acyl-carrier-protein] synthase-1